MSFKRARANTAGDGCWQQKGLSSSRPPVVHINSVSSLLEVSGQIDGAPTTFLIDSGAAVSVFHIKALPKNYQSSLTNDSPRIVGANGLALDVIGQAIMPITSGVASPAVMVGHHGRAKRAAILTTPLFAWAMGAFSCNL